jgi:hypothetical protein
MKTRRFTLCIAVTFVISACYSTPNPEPNDASLPEITSTPEISSTPKFELPTSTSVPTEVLPTVESSTPTPEISSGSCSVSDGMWWAESNQIDGISNIGLQINVENCHIALIMLFIKDGNMTIVGVRRDNIAIVNNEFSFSESVGEDEFKFGGTFTTATNSQGTLFIPKGYPVDGSTPMERDILFEWSAAPTK